MWEHVILYSGNNTLRIDGATDAQVRLQPREVNILGEDPDELIEKSLPLIEEKGEKLCFGRMHCYV